MQSCGQTTAEPALKEVAWGLQKGNELKQYKKGEGTIYKQMFTDEQAGLQLCPGKLQSCLHGAGREIPAQFPGCSKTICIYREH